MNKKAVLSQRWPRNAPYTCHYMGALKIFGTPWLRPRLLFPKLLWPFVRIDPMNVSTKFEVRNFTRSWDNRGYPKNLGSPWIRPRFLFSKIFNGLLFGLAPYMYPPNLKSIALSVPEIIGGTQNIWAVSGYAHAPFSPKFLMGFYSDWPYKCTRQIWSPLHYLFLR